MSTAEGMKEFDESLCANRAQVGYDDNGRVVVICYDKDDKAITAIAYRPGKALNFAADIIAAAGEIVGSAMGEGVPRQ